jgi:CheY-like chemotaxis protein/anti-sigma regulatory factor (Ser/Thr protein kinase)
MSSRVLIVEDDESLRPLLETLLVRAGYATMTASNGSSALEMLMHDPIDLVLIDVRLPGMSGLEVLKRARLQGRIPRVVVMTGDTAPGVALEAIRQQAFQYIDKPFTSEELLERVRRALQTPPTLPQVEVLWATPRWVELLVPCDRGVADHIHETLMRLKADVPTEVREAVGHAFHELLLNAVEWGGGFDASKQVRISYVRGRKVIVYRISDPGHGFVFDGLSHAAVTNFDRDPLEHARKREEKGMRPGGIGILLAQSVVDELIYNEAQNEVVFMKYLDEQDAAAARRAAATAGRRAVLPDA